eukprot:5624892-Alexandrium_andersonii.AAC.1
MGALKDCRTRHWCREDGDNWHGCTDHEPVEARLRAVWEKPDQKNSSASRPPRPNYRKLSGGTPQAKDYKRKYAEAMDAEWDRRGEGPRDWPEVCEVSYAVGLEVLGREEKPHPLAWI